MPDTPNWVFAIFITAATAFVIFGSIKIVSKVCEGLIPLICLLYVGGSIVILCLNWQFLWPAICLIFETAFTGQAAFGGFIGSGIAAALQFGCARGLFSNESGMGSSPIISCAAATKNPYRASLVAMTSTFWGTVVICLLTGLVIITTMIANQGEMSAFLGINSNELIDGASLVMATYGQIPYGGIVLMCGIVLFAYSTIIG